MYIALNPAVIDHQVNLSQAQQSLATVNSLSQPIVRATIQGPLQSQGDGTNQQMLTYRPQLLQVTNLPNQPYIQVVAQPHQPILPMATSAPATQVNISILDPLCLSCT